MENIDTASTVGLSVIIPVYNAESHLVDCLESITSQTGVDLEIICVDDCSRDNSVAVIRRAMAHDGRISLHELSKNSGAPAARNLGIEKSRGHYTLFVDADDRLVPQSLGKIYALGRELNSDAIKGCMYVAENGRKLTPHHLNQRREWRDTRLIDCPEICHLYQYQSYLLKSSLIKNGSVRFNERLRNFQDPVFMSHLLPLCHRIDVTVLPFYIRTITPNSIITSTWGSDNFNSLVEGATEAYRTLVSAECRDSAAYISMTFSHWWRKIELITDALPKQECLDIFAKIAEFSTISDYRISKPAWRRIIEHHALTLIAEGKFEKAYSRMQDSLRLQHKLPGFLVNLLNGLHYLFDTRARSIEPGSSAGS